MAWIILVVAGLFEVAWSFALKLSQGFTQPAASVATIVLMLASFLLLAYAMKSLPLGTAYAVWTGVGAVGAALVGIVFLGEAASAQRLFFIALIVVGIVGLKFSS